MQLRKKTAKPLRQSVGDDLAHALNFPPQEAVISGLAAEAAEAAVGGETSWVAIHSDESYAARPKPDGRVSSGGCRGSVDRLRRCNTASRAAKPTLKRWKEE